MDAMSIPTPPSDDSALRLQIPRSPSSSRRSTTGSVKSSKSAHRITKRPSSHSPPHNHSHATVDGRHKRVWKACERCRMKKTKCDGEFPCKRCKDDGLVCTAGTRKKTEYKQIPRGYAEVLENSQFALIATVQKLYAMVRDGQSWNLGEPELNDRGQPVIHNIATMLGCIRPQHDLDLPLGDRELFPEDEAGLLELAASLDAHQKDKEVHGSNSPMESSMSPPSALPSPQLQSVKLEAQSQSQRTDRASSSELDHSDMESDYRKAALGRLNGPNNTSPMHKGTPPTAPSLTPSTAQSTMGPSLSPQSLTYDFEVGSVASDVDTASVSAQTLFPGASPMSTSFPRMPSWNHRPASNGLTSQQLAQLQASNVGMGTLMDIDQLLSQGLLESDCGQLKPHMLNCPNPEVMMGIGDPMIYGGYDGETLRM